MAITKTKLSQSSVTVDIDIEKLLGESAKNRDIRETFYQLAFDKMIERLDSGRDVNGKLFSKYSKAYKDSLAFSAFGKSSTVNLQLTGDMINSVQIEKQTDKIMTVGFGSDKLENAKAYAHMSGYEGHPTLEGKVKPRLFFGWSDKELKDIAKEFKPFTSVQSNVSDSALLKLLDKLVG